MAERELFHSVTNACKSVPRSNLTDQKGRVMQLGPDKTERLARARADLRMGVPVVLCDGDERAIVAAAETCDPARLEELQSAGLDLHLAISARRAATLKARAYDGDL